MESRGIGGASALARIIGVSHVAVGNYLKGLAEPKAEELWKLSKALDVTMEFLLKGETQPAPEPTSSALVMHEPDATTLARLELLRDLISIRHEIVALEKRAAYLLGVNLEKVEKAALEALERGAEIVKETERPPTGGRKEKLKRSAH